MCLILFAYSARPDYKLILAANRDEFYYRETAPLDYWPDKPDILGGRDLECHGTWLGVSSTRRWAAVTNYREPLAKNSEWRSRGALITDYLLDSGSPELFLARLIPESQHYGGFNLIAGDSEALFHLSNREGIPHKLTPGVYGLSNHLLNTPWPKVNNGKAKLSRLLKNGDLEAEALFDLLYDATHPPDRELPDTGVGLEWERMLSPMFIISPIYGTRSSSVVLIDADDQIVFYERSFAPGTGKILETRKRLMPR